MGVPARVRLALLATLVVAAAAPTAAEPPIPAARGFVTDLAGVVDADHARRIETLARLLRDRTGAEIAVLTVESTEPLDDFTYAMRVAEAWRIGRRDEDTGVLVLLAVRDRKVRVLVGYGLEGVLPDGLVGEIQDAEMVPAFRAGRPGEGLWRGVAAMAARIAADRGVTLDGLPAPPPARGTTPLPGWAILLLLVVVVMVYLAMHEAGGRSVRSRRGGIPMGFPGGFGRGGGFGGGGGGFGGFGGFGGGRFGGGGAGRSW